MVALSSRGNERFLRRALGDEGEVEAARGTIQRGGGGALPSPAVASPPTPTPRHMRPEGLQVGQPALPQATPDAYQISQEPQQGPALGQPQPTQEPQQDPAARQQAVEIARQSAEAAKTASPEQKKALNAELGGIVGGEDNLAEAYKQAIERLGGEQEVGDLKLSRQDFGLFLMDFGMRMMASQRGDVGGAIGEAGALSVGKLMATKADRNEQARQYNKDLRSSAMEIAKAEMANRQGALNANQFIETERGLYNPRTGQYARDPETGEILRGAATADQFATSLNREALISAGLPPAVAAQIVSGRSPSPAAMKDRLRSEWYDLMKSMSARHEMTLPNGERKKMRDWTDQDIDAWANSIVESIYPEMRSKKPALSE